jgi:hypothetical protein
VHESQELEEDDERCIVALVLIRNLSPQIQTFEAVLKQSYGSLLLGYRLRGWVVDHFMIGVSTCRDPA